MEIKTLISEEKLNNRIKEIASQIDKDYNGEEIVLVCILKGAVIFYSELVKNIKSDVVLDFMRISSYEGTQSTGKINIKLDISQNLKNKNVIIVEDIVDSGRTLSYLKKYLKEKGAKSVKICAMLDKKEKRVFDVDVDYTGFVIEDKFVIGYGLDYDEKYRNLPFIGYIE